MSEPPQWWGYGKKWDPMYHRAAQVRGVGIKKINVRPYSPPAKLKPGPATLARAILDSPDRAESKLALAPRQRSVARTSWHRRLRTCRHKSTFGPCAVRARDPRAVYFPWGIAILGRRRRLGRRAAAYRPPLTRPLRPSGRLGWPPNIWSEVEYLCYQGVVKRYETGSVVFYIGKYYINPYGAILGGPTVH